MRWSDAARSAYARRRLALINACSHTGLKVAAAAVLPTLLLAVYLVITRPCSTSGYDSEPMKSPQLFKLKLTINQDVPGMPDYFLRSPINTPSNRQPTCVVAYQNYGYYMATMQWCARDDKGNAADLARVAGRDSVSFVSATGVQRWQIHRMHA